MPELPEVEVTRLGLVPAVTGARVVAVRLSEVAAKRGLRWPITKGLAKTLCGLNIDSITRRGKYLLLHGARDGVPQGTLLIHLGMTGTVRLLPSGTPPVLHDHVDIELEQAGRTTLMRYHDPRRFGAVLWHSATEGALAAHPLLEELGVEPFSKAFTAEHLFRESRGRTVAVKQFLLAGRAVVGVGNIYCSESLFHARIRPTRATGKLTRADCARLVPAIQSTLQAALDKGGSTLKDFRRSDGSSGYFQLDYMAYDRAGLPCKLCAKPILQIVQGQRSTYFCSHCQR